MGMAGRVASFIVEDVKTRRDAIARRSAESAVCSPSGRAVVPVSRKGTEVYQRRDQVAASYHIVSYRIVSYRVYRIVSPRDTTYVSVHLTDMLRCFHSVL